MASPPGNTSSYQRVEAVPSEQQKQLFALQYGSPNAPGRIMLREASRLGKTIENFNLGKPGSAEAFFGYNPTVEDYRNILSNKPNYLRKFEDTGAKTAANGGLMTLRGYATGGALTSEEAKFVQDMAVKAQNRTALSTTEIDRLNKIETRTGKNVSPYTDTGTKDPGNKAVLTASQALAAEYKDSNPQNPNTSDNYAKELGPTYSIADALYGNTAGYSPSAEYAPWEGITSKAGQQAYDLITNNQMPAEFGAASNMYQASGDALMKAAGYTPSNVSAQSASAGTSSAGRGSASQAQAAQMGNVADVTAPEMQYFQADRGNIRDATASQAEAYGYDASNMQAPQGIEALGYDASQMNRADVRDINAQLADVERYNASLMNAPQDIQAQAYNAAQAGTNQMNMPSSWTEAGTAQKYMNPYIQNVVDIQKREANRDYQKQLNELNKQAVGAKAYGGSRLAIERAEAARNQATKLADIEAEGLNQAYQQGMGQFTTEQGQTLQAGQANLTAAQQSELANQQALNTQRQIYVTQALEAAKNNYGGQLTAAQQNQIAQNAASQFNAQAQNTAYNNYVAQQLAADQANQQMDYSVSAANQAALNAQKSQYVTQALQAAQNNYGGQLTAAQQNQVAQNAASQFYAQSQNQSAQAYAAQQLAVQQLNQGMDAQTVMANLQANLGVQGQEAQQILNAALANQQTQFGIGSLNANLANQTALTNAQLGTQASLQNAQLATQSSIANAANQTQISGLNAQNALQAQMANQQAGLTANQQGIAALTAAQGAGQGLLATGNAANNWTLGQAGALGQVMNTATGLQQDYLNQQQKNAIAQQTGAITNTSGPIQITQGTATTPAGQAGTTGTR